eukprot:jgi/Mesvir1/21983/Mv04519-RA.1
MTTAYPLSSQVGTPTTRSQQVQDRVNDLATKVFTGYQLQSLRTYMPNLQFKVEEGPIITHNVLDEGTELVTLLREFIASVYIYDLLANMMRDFHQRVTNATSFGNETVSAAELGKIATALRGFKATTDPAKNNVYLGRIPAEALVNVDATSNKIQVPSLGLNPDPLLKIEVELSNVGTNDVPAYNTYTDSSSPPKALVSADSQPARLIYDLATPIVDLGEYSDFHKKKIRAVLNDDKATKFKNIIAKFVRRDVLAFNRMRIAILNMIDNWARSEGALQGLGQMHDPLYDTSTPPKLTGYSQPEYADVLLKLGIADHRVTGVPQYSCGPGYGSVFFDSDPRNNARAKVVDPYIVSADGVLVENPRAIFGPVCQRQRVSNDLLGMPAFTNNGGPVANFHPAGAKRVSRRKKRSKSRR